MGSMDEVARSDLFVAMKHLLAPLDASSSSASTEKQQHLTALLSTAAEHCKFDLLYREPCSQLATNKLSDMSFLFTNLRKWVVAGNRTTLTPDDLLDVCLDCDIHPTQNLLPLLRSSPSKDNISAEVVPESATTPSAVVANLHLIMDHPKRHVPYYVPEYLPSFPNAHAYQRSQTVCTISVFLLCSIDSYSGGSGKDFAARARPRFFPVSKLPHHEGIAAFGHHGTSSCTGSDLQCI